MYDNGAWSDPLMTLWTTGGSYKQIRMLPCAQEDVHADICDSDAIGLQVHQLACHLVLPRKRNFAHDTCIEAWHAQSTNQKHAHISRRDQRGQKLKRLLGVQPGTVPCDQFEGGLQEIICSLDQRAQVDPKEGQEYVAGFGVRLVYSFAIPIEEESKVAP